MHLLEDIIFGSLYSVDDLERFLEWILRR